MKRVLLDHCVPRPLAALLFGVTIATAKQMGWTQLKNGELLAIAESAGFDVLITSDKNLRYQQNLATRRIAIIEMPTNRLSQLPRYAPQVNSLLATIAPGTYEVLAP